MTDERELIRSRIDLVQLVGQRVSLKKAGKNWKGLCPFHDDRNPSFDVNPERGVYRCWSCGASGDAFTWVMETERVDFADALRILAKEAGVELSRQKKRDPSLAEAQSRAMNEALSYFQSQLQKSKVAQDYCQEREIDQATIDHWGIGYAPDVSGALATHLHREGHRLALCESLFLVKQDDSGGFEDRFRGRLMFPIHDERGNLVAFGGRIIGDGVPKYINSGDTPIYNKSRVLYGMNHAKARISELRQAVLVEGYLDVVACHRAGVTQAVASLGTALAQDHVMLLSRWCDEVIVLYDSDAAGQKATERACHLLDAQKIRIRVAQVPQGMDPDTLLRVSGAPAVRQLVELPTSHLEYLVAQLELRSPSTSNEFWDEAAKILANSTKHQEVVGLIDKLAPKFPGSSDRKVARLAIEGMIKLERAKMRRGRQRQQDEHLKVRRNLVKSYEAIIFKALLNQSLRSEAWAICKESHLFISTEGRRMAEILVNEFPEGFKEGTKGDWVANLQDEGLKGFLLEQEQEIHLLPQRERLQVERASLQGAFKRLRDSYDNNERYSKIGPAIAGETDPNELLEAIKRAKDVSG